MMEDLSLHVLDIAENSIRAGARNVEIIVEEEPEKDRLAITIRDDGEGMDRATVEHALDPFYTTKEDKKVGLGLALLAEAAHLAGGDVKVRSSQGKGTEVVATFGYNHVDRQPLGDMGETIKTLVIGHPEVAVTYEHRRGGEVFRFESERIKKRLSGDGIATPKGIRLLDEALRGEFR